MMANRADRTKAFPSRMRQVSPIARNGAGRLWGRYEEMAPEEFGRALAEDAIIYLPMGSIEWHNNHLPLNTDSIIAEGLCLRLAEKTGGLVLPANPWAAGCTFDKHGPYQFAAGVGTIALFDEALYQGLLRAVAQGVIDNGFRRLVILAGHCGQPDRKVMEALASDINDAGRGRALYLYPYLVTRGDHAGHWETLMVLGIEPGVVRTGKPYVSYSYGEDLTGTESEEEGRCKVEETISLLEAKVRAFFGSDASVGSAAQ